MTLRVATYNVHACVGLDGRRSEARIAEAIASLDVQIVGLQELDAHRRRSARTDQAGLIAERLGWTRFFHPAIRRAEEQYGDAVLSRFPMNLRQGAVLPVTAPWFCPEPRGAIWVDVETPLGLLHIITTHFGLGRRERHAQARLLTSPEWLGRVPPGEPVAVLGDFNSTPGSVAHTILAQRLRDARTFVSPPPLLRSYPTQWPAFAIDHIFVNEALRVNAVSVARSPLTRIASDHFPVVAEIVRTRPDALRARDAANPSS